jgi:4-diphosphocytidyl-2-C-methyl-D-erythritol kinase
MLRSRWTTGRDAQGVASRSAATSAAGVATGPAAAHPSTAVDFAAEDVLEVTAPAKINLFLEVLGKRPDGFHELETLMAPISLADTLRVRVNDSGDVAFRCAFSGGADPALGFADVPADDTNLVVRAVKAVRQETRDARGLDVELIKRIPAAAGLGGGSSDAAAALVAANLAWSAGVSPERLAELALQLGSDVPFFLGPGAAICRGRGEKLTPVAGLAGLDLVIVRPPVGLSTAAVFKACKPSTSPRTALDLALALAARDFQRGARLFHNQLQPAAASLCPWIGRLADAFEQAGVAAHQMSGSGTSYFGLCRSAAHARQTAGRLRAQGLGAVFVVRTQ